MSKIAEFIYWLNLTRPRVDGVFHAVWDAGVVRARLEVNYRTKVKLDILAEEIAKVDPKEFAIEVAEQMEAEYRERM